MLRTSILFIFLSAIMCCKRQEAQDISQRDIDTTVKFGQVNALVTIDQSPMDISYYPSDYPILKMNETGKEAPIARVIYSRPHKKGRKVFGTSSNCICVYGKEWRLGANEATEIEFFRDLSIAGKPIKAGRYVIYCIPFADRWSIILNTNLYTWGLHMDSTKDVFKIDLPVAEQKPALEDFTMVFNGRGDSVNLQIAWDQLTVSLPMVFQQQ